VTESLGEIRTVLAGVAEQLGTAYRHAGVARARITDAIAVLTALDAGHSEPLVPVELQRAGAELDRGLTLIAGGAAVVADIDARL
jgi:hypothetical protein